MSEPPVGQVMAMIEQGLENEEIVSHLQESGFSNVDIQEALSQAKVKASVEGQGSDEESLPPPPTRMRASVLSSEPERQEPYAPSQQPVVQPSSPEMWRGGEEKIEEVAESIIGEKWRRMAEDMGEMSSWKELMKREIVSVKQEVLRVEERFESLQKAILGRLKEYDSSVGEVSTDVKAV